MNLLTGKYVAKPSMLATATVASRPKESIDGSKIHDGTSTTDNVAVAGPTYDTAARGVEIGNLTRKSCSLSHWRVNIFGLLGKKEEHGEKKDAAPIGKSSSYLSKKNVDSHTSLQVLLCQVRHPQGTFGNCTLPLIECYTCRDFFGNCTLPFDKCHTCSNFFGDCTLPIIKFSGKFFGYQRKTRSIKSCPLPNYILFRFPSWLLDSAYIRDSCSHLHLSFMIWYLRVSYFVCWYFRY